MCTYQISDLRRFDSRRPISLKFKYVVRIVRCNDFCKFQEIRLNDHVVTVFSNIYRRISIKFNKIVWSAIILENVLPFCIRSPRAVTLLLQLHSAVCAALETLPHGDVNAL